MDNRRVLLLISSVLMLTGLSIYLLFNKDAIITAVVDQVLRIPAVRLEGMIGNIIKGYVADLLWSSSFTLVIQAIVWVRSNRVWLLSLSSLLGITYELLQYSGVANGTADIVDVFVYIVGSAVSIIIILGGRFYEKN